MRGRKYGDEERNFRAQDGRKRKVQKKWRTRMTEMVRVDEKEERRGKTKRSEGEGEDNRLFFRPLPLSSSRRRTHEKREEIELNLWLPHDKSNFHREETRGEKERRLSLITCIYNLNYYPN